MPRPVRKLAQVTSIGKNWSTEVILPGRLVYLQAVVSPPVECCNHLEDRLNFCSVSEVLVPGGHARLDFAVLMGKKGFSS